MNPFDLLLKRFDIAIANSESELKHFQSLRSNHSGKKISNNKFWGSNSRFGDEYYAFHHGGQKELQFNISEEDHEENGMPVFRYGMAFSFIPARGNNDPVEAINPFVERFNLFLKQHPLYFRGYKMWTWFNGRSEPFNVRSIEKELMQRDAFVFFGKDLQKYTTEITDEDIETMIDEFEYLLPVYKFVQLGDDKAVTQNKISKICWNENRWIRPSGKRGKSKFKKSHEYREGFGHEEWLLDFSKKIDGYHYGFLEPIHKFRDKYIGSTFNISLYSINSDTKEKFWIGEIKNVEVIGYDECTKVVDEYKRLDWISEMEEDLRELGLKSDSLIKNMDKILFNIKFEEKDYRPLVEPMLISNDDEAIRSSRYILLNKKIEPIPIRELTGEFIISNKFETRKLSKSVKRSFVERSIEIPQIHNDISIGLEDALRKIYDKVVPENPTGYGTSIDMVVEHENKVFFYEIKTYSHIMSCIRNGLGQLIEYAYYPSRSLADKLYIVSQHKSDPQSREYIIHLRKTLKFPLYYLCFDCQSGKIIEEF